MKCDTLLPSCLCSLCFTIPRPLLMSLLPSSFEHYECSWPPPYLCSSLSDLSSSSCPPAPSRHTGPEAALPADRGQLWHRGNRMVKMAVWGLSTTLGAAVFAVAWTAMDWGPEVLLQLFWRTHDEARWWRTVNCCRLSRWINIMQPQKHKRWLWWL